LGKGGYVEFFDTARFVLREGGVCTAIWPGSETREQAEISSTLGLLVQTIMGADDDLLDQIEAAILYNGMEIGK
jgi:hypothetical protein